MTDIVLIVLVLLVVGIGLWWLLGATKPAPAEKRIAEEPAAPRAEPPPVVAGPAATPVDVPPPTLAPAPEPVAPPPGVAAGAAPDNLLLLKGVGPKLVTLLASLGVTRFDQIAAWTDADIAAVDARLGTFKGRATRDQWVEQAGYLAKGDRAGFEARFGKIEG